MPRHFIHVVAASVHVAPAQVSATGGKFPFSLGRQAEGLARELVQLGNKCMAVVPVDIFHGTAQVFVISVG